MSSALAIAGVTAVLRSLLDDGMITQNISSIVDGRVAVTVLPPDRVETGNGSEHTQLNLFLHQVTFNNGWRNHGLPSCDSSGRYRLTNPPLALDLHYLLSVYSAEELEGEILLGYAMQLLHETPVLDRTAIRRALENAPAIGDSLPPALRALAESGLADQVEQIKVVPEPLSTEDLSKFWTATQSHYRPTAAYLATVVLIESNSPTRPTLPVLSRGRVDPISGRERGVAVEPSLLAPLPTIQSIVPRSLQPTAEVGSLVDINGHHLNGSSGTVRLTNDRVQLSQDVGIEAGSTGTSALFIVPDVPVGVYQVFLSVIRPGDRDPRSSNQLALVIGPEITTPLPIDVTLAGDGTATIALEFRPEVRPGQTVSLLLGGQREVVAPPIESATDTLNFFVENAPVGEHLVRLRVDGIESPIIDRMGPSPTFLNNRVTIR